MNKSQRAKDIAVKAVLFMMEDQIMKITWETVPDKEKLIKKIATYTEQQLEEYAGNRPIEAGVKVVLTFPDSVYGKDLYLKDPHTGVLKPVEFKERSI